MISLALSRLRFFRVWAGPFLPSIIIVQKKSQLVSDEILGLFIRSFWGGDKRPGNSSGFCDNSLKDPKISVWGNVATDESDDTVSQLGCMALPKRPLEGPHSVHEQKIWDIFQGLTRGVLEP